MLCQGELKYENEASNMDIPSSPFGPSLMSSSRRASMVSSSNFSATSPLDAAGPTTPQSYGSQMSFEPLMADRCQPSLSFADSSFSTSESFGYETPEYDSNGFQSQKMSYSWTDSLISEASNLDINLHIDADGFRYLQSLEHRCPLYPTECATKHEEIFNSSSNDGFDLHSIMSNTIVPGQMHNNHIYATPYASTVSTPAKGGNVYSDDCIMGGNIARPFYPYQSCSPSSTNSLTRSMSIKNEVKQTSLLSTPPRRAAAGPSTRIIRYMTETADGQCISTGIVGKSRHECKLDDCRSTFRYKEHLHRHQKKHRGEGMVQCKVCEHFFTRQDNLRQHFEKVHFNIACHRPRKTRLREKREDGSIFWRQDLIAEYGVEAEMIEFERKIEAGPQTPLERKRNRRSSKDSYRHLARL